MNNIKIEYQQIKSGAPASIGLMVEINAPEVLATNIIARPARGLVFVIDRSGSMGGGRLEVVKSTILDILGQLDKNDYLSVVTFDDNTDVAVAMQRVGDLDLARTRKLIGELQTGGSTNLERGYRIGLAEAANAPTEVEVSLILLSDGHANEGIQDPIALAQLAAAATEHLISTSTLGIGESYDERILVGVANTGKGSHFAAVNFAEAALGLNNEIAGILTRAISDLQVSVSVDGGLSEHVTITTPHYVHNRENLQGSSSTAFTLGSLGSLEERNFVCEMKVMTCLDDESQTHSRTGVVTVRVEYRDEVAGGQVNFERSFAVAEVSAENWIEPARDEDIVMELATARAQDIKARALEAARHGDIRGAREMLRAAGLDLHEIESNSAQLTERNRARARLFREEFDELSEMSPEMLIKRGEESIKRGRENKPDPRKPNTDSRSNPNTDPNVNPNTNPGQGGR